MIRQQAAGIDPDDLDMAIDMAVYLATEVPAVRRTVDREISDPAQLEKLTLDVVGAAVHYVQQARALQKLPDTVTMSVTVPFEPRMLPLWRAAAPMLAEEFIDLDWTKWHLWIVDRDDVGDDFDPSPFVGPVKGEYRIRVNGISLASTQKATATPEEARTIAARLLMAAEEAEHLQAAAVGGGR